MSERVIILKKPVVHGSETIAELKLREMIAEDIWDASKYKDGVAGTLQLAGKLCGQPDSVMKQLSMPDVEEVVKLVQSFLPDFQATGETALEP